MIAILVTLCVHFCVVFFRDLKQPFALQEGGSEAWIFYRYMMVRFVLVYNGDTAAADIALV